LTRENKQVRTNLNNALKAAGYLASKYEETVGGDYLEEHHEAYKVVNKRYQSSNVYEQKCLLFRKAVIAVMAFNRLKKVN